VEFVYEGNIVDVQPFETLRTVRKLAFGGISSEQTNLDLPLVQSNTHNESQRSSRSRPTITRAAALGPAIVICADLMKLPGSRSFSRCRNTE
jgi:hypothetical protein